MSDRYQPLRELAKQHQLDALALVPSANFERLFNKSFHQNERPLLVLVPQQGDPLAIVPELELGSFELIGFEGDVFDWRDQTGYQPAFDGMLERFKGTRIGVEGQAMRVFIHHAMLAANPSLELVDAGKAIATLRLHKSDTEIELLKEAIKLSETALAQTIDQVRVGMTEKAIEGRLLQEMFRVGGTELSFSPIVAAGDNSARPHASARADYEIKAGDALLFDFGIRHKGLCADITRTFFVERCSDTHRAIYETVLAANQQGHAASNPGATAHDVDDAVMRVLEDSDYSDRIRHKTGHGLGRDVHEDPYIMRGNQETLEPGMVYTIEPGLYSLDDMGVRIEDDVLITESGCESLTSFDKALTII